MKTTKTYRKNDFVFFLFENNREKKPKMRKTNLFTEF